VLPDTSFRKSVPAYRNDNLRLLLATRGHRNDLGTFDTCSLTLTTSGYRERPEVIDEGQADAIDPIRTSISARTKALLEAAGSGHGLARRPRQVRSRPLILEV
jgi:hypothetical protein